VLYKYQEAVFSERPTPIRRKKWRLTRKTQQYWSPTLLKTAKANGFEVFVSPHYYYPTDRGWKFGGTIENVMHEIKMFDRTSALNLEGFSGSGADWLERYKPYIEDGKTVVCSPHKVYGPENNDVALQLRKRGIDKVILGGMSANLCVEAHLRELLEQGFEVTVVKDATAGARHPEWRANIGMHTDGDSFYAPSPPVMPAVIQTFNQ
jgi:nicotinamidase-related amidase